MIRKCDSVSGIDFRYSVTVVISLAIERLYSNIKRELDNSYYDYIDHRSNNYVEYTQDEAYIRSMVYFYNIEQKELNKCSLNDAGGKLAQIYDWLHALD